MSVSLMDIRNALAETRDPGRRDYGSWSLHEKSLNNSNGVVQAGREAAISEMIHGKKANLPSPGFSGASNVSPNYTGPGSLFGVLGSESSVMSLRIQPRSLSGVLPAKPSRQMQPYFPYFTGIQAGTGSNSTFDSSCADPPTAGPGKSGYLSAQFGKVEYQTRTVDITRVGQQINRGEFWDLTLENSPILQLGAPSGSNITTPQNVPGNPQLMMEVLMRMMEVGASFQNALTPMVWTGNPTNNVGTDGYAEFPGLDILIGTAQVDFFTGLPISALNSTVMNANFARIDDNAVNTVQNFVYMTRNLKSNATRMNLDPVTWLIAMREDLFFELTAIWPCAYLTNRCNVAATNGGQTEQIITGKEQTDMRDEMRQGRYLLIDGERWPVVFDDGITELTGTTSASVKSGDFSSNIYIIPVTYNGGKAATYFEYFDWTGDFAAMSQLATQGIAAPYYYTDGGRFLWHWKGPINFCLQWLALIRPRIILHTPQLAGKIQNVVYGTPLHTREPFTTDPYFFNGGVSGNRTVQTGFDDWGQHNNPPN